MEHLGAMSLAIQHQVDVKRAEGLSGPSARDLVLLSDSRFISEPNFYKGCVDALFLRNFVQAGEEFF